MNKTINRGSSRVLAALALAAGIAFGQAPAQAQTAITVVQAADAQPRNLLPTRGGNLAWIKNVFETLTLRDIETLEPQPLLAESWELAGDGLSMTLRLRDDVTFHSGRKMTAEDVKFSLETAAAPETAAQTGFIAQALTDIEVLSDVEVKISFARRLPNIFDLFEETPIIDQETYAEREDGSQVIGTGPYRFAKWTPGAEIVLTRYDGYRDAEAASIDTVNFAIIGDPTAVVAALRSRRAQIAFNLVPRIAQTFSRDPGYVVRDGGGAIFPLGLNVSMPPFDQKEVRQAVGYAIDRERINDQVFAGTGTPTPLFWSPREEGYSADLAASYPYDPEKAKAMIEAAGATGASVEMIVPSIPPNLATAEILQNNLREIGLEPAIQVLDVPTYDKRQVAGDLGQSFGLIHGLIGYSASTLLGAAPSLREGNPSQFWTPEYQQLRDALEAAPDQEKPAALEALTAYMIDEAFTLAIVQGANQTVISNAVEGVILTNRGHLLLHDARLVR